MRPDLQNEVRAWIRKTENDLRAAERLLAGDDPVLDAAVYHCQQATEKALKGFLALHELPFEKTHSLPALLWHCVDIDETFNTLRDTAEFLNPFSTRFRYPGDVAEPDVDEANEALERARDASAFVFLRMPKGIRP
jgi:HEPN domain-containing protein